MGAVMTSDDINAVEAELAKMTKQVWEHGRFVELEATDYPLLAGTEPPSRKAPATRHDFGVDSRSGLCNLIGRCTANR